MPSQPTPLWLPATPGQRLKTIGYDLFMFTQLIAFYGLCFTLGILCYSLDKLLKTSRCLDSFIQFFSLFANLGKKEP